VFRTGGENYSPEEAEAVLRSHGDVDRAVVIPVADEVLGQVGAAYVVMHDRAPFDPDALGAYCRERLASYKVPRFIRSVAAADLPLTASGKVQRLSAPPQDGQPAPRS
jgi:fatty-acyl-CoA synthase